MRSTPPTHNSTQQGVPRFWTLVAKMRLDPNQLAPNDTMPRGRTHSTALPYILTLDITSLWGHWEEGFIPQSSGENIILIALGTLPIRETNGTLKGAHWRDLFKYI